MITTTTPKGETTTIKREATATPKPSNVRHPTAKPRPRNTNTTAHGELESVTEPARTHMEIRIRQRRRSYGRNRPGRQQAHLGIQRRLAGDRDGQPARQRRQVANREIHDQNRTRRAGPPLKITDPLGHTTKYTYDGDGNVETVTDGNGHTTKYTYNGDNQPTKVEEPNGTVTETEYDGAGQVISQIDGSKHETKYMRNALEEVTEVVRPARHENAQGIRRGRQPHETDRPQNAPRPTNTIRRTVSPKSATPAATPPRSNTNTTKTATAQK